MTTFLENNYFNIYHLPIPGKISNNKVKEKEKVLPEYILY